MKTVEVEKREIDRRAFLRRSVLENDYSYSISADSEIVCDGKRIAVLERLRLEDVSAMRWAVKHVQINKDYRTSGLNTNSTIFGFSPREPLRKDFCSATRMATAEPKQHSVFVDFAKFADAKYRQHFPETYQEHCKLLEDTVKDEWLLSGTVFTSGIVNDQNALKYHCDNGNFKNTCSVMLVLRNGMQGGDLILPEYNCKIICDDACLFIFDGQSVMHGVNEMRGRAGQYRYSVVFYSLQQMQHCQSLAHELKRIRELKTKRERAQAS